MKCFVARLGYGRRARTDIVAKKMIRAPNRIRKAGVRDGPVTKHLGLLYQLPFSQTLLRQG